MGWVNEELYYWHRAGTLNYTESLVEPLENWENADTKRRFANLLARTGVLRKLCPVEARRATRDEICAFHTPEYHDKIKSQSRSELGGNGGENACFQFGGYDIASLSAGGVLAAVEAVSKKEIDTAYCLVRPPGHHAKRDFGMGFCIFNNIAIAALKLKEMGYRKIAIVDYDVHHGNGTEEAFFDDPDVLFISIHQDNNYPQGNSGGITTKGSDKAKDSKTGMYTTINIPLPPGSGSGAYRYAFSEVVIPSVSKFEPDFILVSSGFDASYSDCLGAMMLSSEDYRVFTSMLMSVASVKCEGRIVFAHEGGYSKDYVPFCGLGTVQALLGIQEATEEGYIKDPYLEEVTNWGYQDLQSHQLRIVDTAAMLHGLKDMDTVINNQLKSLSANLLRIPGMSKETAAEGILKYGEGISRVQEARD